MSAIWQTVFAIIASVGGTGFIICAVVKFASDKIAARLEAKYQLKLDMKLERFKSGLDKKKYVSKVRFDTEFALFKNLWCACRKMVNDVYFVYPTFANVPADEEARKKYEQNVYETAHNSHKVFIELLGNNAPFISADIYAKFNDIGQLCRKNLNLYEERWNRGRLFVWEGSQEKRDAECKAYERTDEFNQKYNTLIDELRTYLNKLDVGEQEDSPNE